MTTYTQIPGLSFAIRQSLDRLLYQHKIYNQEFVERLLLLMGHPNYFTNTSYGVVTPVNPQSAVPLDSNPLTVSINGTDLLTVDINPGMAVTRSGMWVVLQDYVRNVTLADVTTNIPNIIYVKYITVDASPLEVNDYKAPVVPYTKRPGGIDVNGINTLGNAIFVGVVTVNDYLAYTDDVKSNIVPIAIVTPQRNSTGTGWVISIDHTNDNYTWNRPWFSAQDVEHRAKLGSGTVTDENAHGLAFDNLSSGEFSYLQLLLDHGMILADDISVPKQPGTRCITAIPSGSASRLTDDGSGTNTGFANAQYVELPSYPVRLGKVWTVDSLGVEVIELAALLVPETNRVVFPIDDIISLTEEINVYYTKVEACEPPIGNNNTTFTAKNPITQERIVAGGVGHNTLASTSLDMSNAQKFPMLYDALVDAEGSLLKTPQVVYCYKTLDSIGSTDTFSIAQYGPGRIMMGLAGAGTDPGMLVEITVSGKDINGIAVSHQFSFSGSTPYVDPCATLPAGMPTDSAVKISGMLTPGLDQTLFYSLDQITIDTRTNDTANSAIVIWVLLNPIDTYDKLKDACHIANFMWDGLRISNILDKRIINTNVRDFLTTADSVYTLDYTLRSLAGGNATVYVEDFRNPKYHTQLLNSDYAQTLVQALPVNNLSKLRIGDYGWYRTRALPVMAGSGNVWRVVLLPAYNPRSYIYYTGNPPILDYFSPGGGPFLTVTMTPVTGSPGTYETTLGTPPTRIRVHVQTIEHIAMLIYG